jgi:site-specific DNA-adenine methylase
VKITCADYSTVLDAPGDGAWLFIDPPYDFHEHPNSLYECEFTEEQQRQLKDRLLACPHEFLLTIGITPLTESLYLTGEFDVTCRQYKYCCMLRSPPKHAGDSKETSTSASPPKRLEMIVRKRSHTPGP